VHATDDGDVGIETVLKATEAWVLAPMPMPTM
jgi:hypothetical protein